MNRTPNHVSSAVPMTGKRAQADAVRRDHWNAVYSGHSEERLSWFQADPRLSVELIEDLTVVIAAGAEWTAQHTAKRHATKRKGAVIDVGGGMSRLAFRLVDRGFTDVTVLDISAPALEAARRRPGGDRVAWIRADLLTWRPQRRYDVWHDRAVFHFLTDAADRAIYLATLRAALAPGGAIVLATFAPDGPTHCSGLPVARYSAAQLTGLLTDAFGDAVTVTGHRTDQHHTPGGAVQAFTWITARLHPAMQA